MFVLPYLPRSGRRADVAATGHIYLDNKTILSGEPYRLWLFSVKAIRRGGGLMTNDAAVPSHSVICLRLMQAFRRVSRGMRRWQDGAAPPSTAPLSPRHIAALEQLLGSPLTVGELAARLGLTLPTVSGVLSDLDRAGFIERHPDPADRRRTIVQVIPGQAALIGQWLDGAAKPIARVLDQLSPTEQEAFLKAMDLLDTELQTPAD